MQDTRSNACDPSTSSPPRPFATLYFNNDPTPFKDTHIRPAEVKTSNSGEIKLRLVPPVSSNGGIGIAGVDVLMVNPVDPAVIIDRLGTHTYIQRIENQYPLSPMPGSATCPGGGRTYVFVAQNNHGCQFYGLVYVNNALVNISDEYFGRQIQCSNSNFSANDKCVTTDDLGRDSARRITGDPIQVRITAMSLKWGGLNDIGPLPNCGTPGHSRCYDPWNPPHRTHNDGTTIDAS